jgi:hypothetical protein
LNGVSVQNFDARLNPDLFIVVTRLVQTFHRTVKQGRHRDPLSVAFERRGLDPRGGDNYFMPVLMDVAALLRLREIKDKVVELIVSWIADTLVPRLSWGSPLILTVSTIADKSRVVTHTVDDPFCTRKQLRLRSDDGLTDVLNVWASVEKGRITSFLFREAKANRFPKELSRFDVLLEEVRDVTESLTRLANDSIADLVATKIPQAATYEMQNTMAEWTSPFGLVVACVEGAAATRGNLFERFVHEFDPVALDPNLQWGNAGIEGTVKNFQFRRRPHQGSN